MLVIRKRMTVILSVVAVLLLIPFTAMQFTDEVNWDLFDFIVALVLLAGTGLACEFVLQKVQKTSHRIVVCGGILLALLLVWVELAVGIFGSPLAGS